MKPGGGTRTRYAHSVNRTRLVRNAHIHFDAEEDEEDADSLFVPELPASLRSELEALRRKQAAADRAMKKQAAEDLKAMKEERRDAESVTPSTQLDAESVKDTNGAKVKAEPEASTGKRKREADDDGPAAKKVSVSNSVAARLAAIRASRTTRLAGRPSASPQPNSNALTEQTRAAAARSLSAGSQAGAASPGSSALETRRAELARIRATMEAVNTENETMLQAMEDAEAKRAKVEAEELEKLEIEIAAENERLEAVKRQAAEIQEQRMQMEDHSV